MGNACGKAKEREREGQRQWSRPRGGGEVLRLFITYLFIIVYSCSLIENEMTNGNNNYSFAFVVVVLFKVHKQRQ